MASVQLSNIERKMRYFIQHYNPRKYWKYRNDDIRYTGGTSIAKIVCEMKLLYIKRCDAFNNASLGTHIGFGAEFRGIPIFPHGLYGIIISHNAIIGENVTIYHQVTIGEGKGGSPVIGDRVLIGAGAKIIGRVHIGSGTRIGSGCVINKDVPENATVFAPEPTIVLR